jgi:hypothetical protein
MAIIKGWALKPHLAKPRTVRIASTGLRFLGMMSPPMDVQITFIDEARRELIEVYLTNEAEARNVVQILNDFLARRASVTNATRSN